MASNKNMKSVLSKVSDEEIRQMVQEALTVELNNFITEKTNMSKTELNKRKLHRKNAHVKDADVRNADGNKDINVPKQAQEVISQIKNGPYTKAELMRQLWHPQTQDEDDALRSLFSKKLNHKLNDDGVPYKFDKDEITTLAHILDTANS